MTLIARLYGSHETATACADELQKKGFAANAVQVVAAPQAAAEGGEALPDTALDLVRKTGIPTAQAEIYAEGVRRGEVLVVVDPPFGLGYRATTIMYRFNPIAVTVPDIVPEPGPGFGGDSAAPLSAALGWPVLLSDPAPLSTYFKWPTLKPQPASSATLDRVRKQSAEPAPLSKAIGMKVLSDQAAPFSAMLGWPVLWQTAAPLSAKTGWPVLLDNPAPLSTKLGWRLLLNNPTPLSSLLGMAVLSKR